MTRTPSNIVAAHQYLYYVLAFPIWSDFAYDAFCKHHGIEGGGGSDSASDYSAEAIELADAMRAQPSAFPPISAANVNAILGIGPSVSESSDADDDAS